MKKLFFLSLLALAACKKTNDPPMGASNGGQSFLSCKINGKQYTFKGKPTGLNSDGVGYDFGITNDIWNNLVRFLKVSGHDISKQHAVVMINFKSDTSHRFPLNRRISFSEVAQREVYVLLESPVDFSNSYYYADGNGWIKFSRVDSIGAGTFGFTAYPIDNNGQRVLGSDSIIVTDGRFDIHN